MVLTGKQWGALKRIRWSDTHSRRLQQRVGDDKLVAGFDRKAKHWVLARLCDTTVMTKFGVRTIPTRETAPIIWKHWLDDDGVPLRIDDPRLITYIRRCDLWRQGPAAYLKQYDHQDWIEDQKDASEEDELGYIAKHLIYPRVKEESAKMCGFVNRSPIERKYFEPQSMKPWWETSHDKAAA